MAAEEKWMEIFHSKPSMEHCYFLEKLPSGKFTDPSPENELVDASHVRADFRVMRRRATPVEFVLTDGTDRNWDDNTGENYTVDAVPGRYVVEHGIRRVGDANADECRQAIERGSDRFIHLCFRADLWDKCYASYQKNGGDWTPAPGVEMTLTKNAEREGRNFEVLIEARFLSCAFNNGDGVWDANNGDNYRVGLPGKYIISDGGATYVSPSDKDLEDDVMPSKTVGTPMIAEATLGTAGSTVVPPQQ